MRKNSLKSPYLDDKFQHFYFFWECLAFGEIFSKNLYLVKYRSTLAISTHVRRIIN